MLPCQQALMLDAAVAFEKLVKSPKSGQGSQESTFQVTWDNPNELENYIEKLQTATEKLTRQNRKLRNCHQLISDKVIRRPVTDQGTPLDLYCNRYLSLELHQFMSNFLYWSMSPVNGP